MFWRVHHVLESVPCSGECTVFWRVYHILESAPCSGECTLQKIRKYSIAAEMHDVDWLLQVMRLVLTNQVFYFRLA